MHFVITVLISIFSSDFQLGFSCRPCRWNRVRFATEKHAVDVAVFVVPRRRCPCPSLELKLHGMGLASAQFRSRGKSVSPPSARTAWTPSRARFFEDVIQCIFVLIMSIYIYPPRISIYLSELYVLLPGVCFPHFLGFRKSFLGLNLFILFGGNVQ